MPIYEFYCRDCHTVYSFLSRTTGNTKRPACPRCGRRALERRVSAFAVSRGRPEPSNEESFADADDSRMEQAMGELAREAEGLNEDDPRQIAGLMRKLFDRTGLPMGQGMEEAIRRMEAGDDLDKIEDELGDALEADEDLSPGEPAEGRLRRLRARLKPPAVDETLYEL